MLPLAFPALSGRSTGYLKKWQLLINKKRYFYSQVTEAHRLWPQKNTTKNKTFQEIRQILCTLSGPLERCQYCGRAEANQIEHIYPKALYPGATFCWDNLLWICDKCNLSKGDKFSIYRKGLRFDLNTRLTGKTKPQKPSAGKAVFLNLRVEDPMAFLHLDFQTGRLLCRAQPGTQEFERTQYTLEILGLNQREALNRSRRQAYRDYCRALEAYICNKHQETQHVKQEIQAMTYPIVWFEMKRQHLFYPELTQLFQQAPEALEW